MLLLSTVLGQKSSYTNNGLVWTDGQLRMNQIQVVGTHNSYHLERPEEEKIYQDAMFDGENTDKYQYSHAALDDQLEHQGVRSIE